MTTNADAGQVGGNHYKKLAIQPWTAMEAWMPTEQFIGFLRGNAIKYLARAGHKDELLEAVKKARHYLDKLVEVVDVAEPPSTQQDLFEHNSAAPTYKGSADFEIADRIMGRKLRRPPHFIPAVGSEVCHFDESDLPNDTEITQPEIDAALASEEDFRASLATTPIDPVADADLVFVSDKFSNHVEPVALPTEWPFVDGETVLIDGEPHDVFAVPVLCNEVRAAAAAVPPVAEKPVFGISGPGKYRTRDNQVADVFARNDDLGSSYTWTGGIDGCAETWMMDGTYNRLQAESDYDLVERIS